MVRSLGKLRFYKALGRNLNTHTHNQIYAQYNFRLTDSEPTELGGTQESVFLKPSQIKMCTHDVIWYTHKEYMRDTVSVMGWIESHTPKIHVLKS